ncbi:MAG: hypothetical protein AB1778_05090 [Candidatus Bipolaricaulota bacterium]
MLRACSWAAMAAVLVSAAATAVTWEEVDWAAQLAPNPKTGAMSVYFSVWMEYDPPQRSVDLESQWTSPSLDPDDPNLTGSVGRYASTEGVTRIVVMSPAIAIAAGQRYTATLTLADRASGLTYSRQFQYLAPAAVPISLRLESADGTTGVDLTGVPDEELEDLVLLARALRLSTRAPGTSDLSDFLSAPLPAEEAFPALVLLVPTAGVSATAGPSGAGVKITVGQTMMIFSLPEGAAVSALRTQTAEYPQPIVGVAFSGSIETSFGSAVRAFLDEASLEVVEAAEAEWTRRTSG